MLVFSLNARKGKKYTEKHGENLLQQTILNRQKHIEFVPLVGHNWNFQIFISIPGDVKDEAVKYVWLSSALFEVENVKENAEVLIN